MSTLVRTVEGSSPRFKTRKIKPEKTRRGRVRAFTAAALVGVGATFGLAAPSSAAASSAPSVTCYGDYCSGQDPETTGCAKDAITTVAAVEIDNGGGRLDLRYSPTCKTNWARWQQYPVGWCMNCSPLTLVAVQDTGYTQKLDWFEKGTSPKPGTYWTPMIYSPVHAVYAGVYMPCGDATVVSAAFDCAMNGLVKTAAA